MHNHHTDHPRSRSSISNMQPIQGSLKPFALYVSQKKEYQKSTAKLNIVVDNDVGELGHL